MMSSLAREEKRERRTGAGEVEGREGVDLELWRRAC